MTAKLTLTAAADSHPGRVHPLNQDNTLSYIRPNHLGRSRGLFIVADGMGGHKAGEIASRLAVETVYEELAWFLEQSDTEETQPAYFKNPGDEFPTPANNIDQLRKRLRIAIEHANRTIASYAQDNPIDAGNMGTTITCVLVENSQIIVANIGDSRTYLLRDGTLHQLTEDHSYVAHLVREGQISPKEIYTHPRRNVITRSLGYRPEVVVDLWVRDIQAGDQLLLCSDGLWEMIQENHLIVNHMVESDSPKKAVSRLIDSANAFGGADNIGVVIVRIQ